MAEGVLTVRAFPEGITHGERHYTEGPRRRGQGAYLTGLETLYCRRSGYHETQSCDCLPGRGQPDCLHRRRAEALFENGIQDRVNIVSLSGTSGGPFVPFSSGTP